jgi:hypothetical protein
MVGLLFEALVGEWEIDNPHSTLRKLLNVQFFQTGHQIPQLRDAYAAARSARS